jgi:signal transduction histidine kinase
VCAGCGRPTRPRTATARREAQRQPPRAAPARSIRPSGHADGEKQRATERLALEKAKPYQTRLEGLVAAWRDLARDEPLDALLARACGRLLEADAADFRVLEPAGLTVRGTWGQAGAERVELGDGLSEVAATRGEPVLSSRPGDDPRLMPSQRATHSLSVDAAGVRLLTADGMLVPIGADPFRFRMGAVSSREGISRLAIETGEVQWSADVVSDPSIPMSPELRQSYAASGYHGILAAPLRAGGKVIGVLYLAHGEARSFSPQEAAVVEALADQAALAVERARLYGEAERRRRQVEVVAGIAATVNASLDLHTVLQRVVEGARSLAGSDMARIALREPGSEAVVVRYAVNSRYQGAELVAVLPGQGLGGQVLSTGGSMRTDDWHADPRISRETRDVVVAEGIVSEMVVPIRIDDRIEGLLFVDNRSPRPFTDDDERALVELERRHIARELHDEIGPSLTALKINLVLVDRGAEPAAQAARLADSLRITQHILDGVRRLSLDLRASLLDDMGLAPAVRSYVRAQAERAGIEAQVTVDAEIPAMPHALSTAVFRVAQEAVTNVLRHAHARHLSVRVSAADGWLVLVVQDDGVGFDVAAARRRATEGGSLGILVMEEHVELAGGRAVIESAPNRGTEIIARFPLPHHASEGSR